MAVTIIQTLDKRLLMFKTTLVEEGDKEDVILLLVQSVNEKLEPTSDKNVSHLSEDAEGFHKDLRIKAAEQDKLITSHSTNPEWNPEGYVKNLETDGDN
jgi:hypothetical protein